MQGTGCQKRTREVGTLPGSLAEVIYPRTSPQGKLSRYTPAGGGLWAPAALEATWAMPELSVLSWRGLGKAMVLLGVEIWINSHVYLPFHGVLK